LEEASSLAKDSHLSINVGSSEELDLLDFDREKVQIILVPEFNNINYLQSVKKGFHQVVAFNNDFITFTKDLNIVFEDNTIRPNVLENHHARFFFLCNNVGDFEAIISDGEELRKVEFNVY
jgi:hypothetical protein